MHMILNNSPYQHSKKVGTHMNSFSDSPVGKPQFNWLKVIGALAVLWLTAKVIGALLSPGMVALGIVLWLIVRSHRRKAQKPVVHFVPTATTFPFPPAAPMSSPVPPAGYWMPTSAPRVFDVRTQAEREIEDYVQQTWPNG
jgi:hypothetical protein